MSDKDPNVVEYSMHTENPFSIHNSTNQTDTIGPHLHIRLFVPTKSIQITITFGVSKSSDSQSLTHFIQMPQRFTQEEEPTLISQVIPPPSPNQPNLNPILQRIARLILPLHKKSKFSDHIHYASWFWITDTKDAFQDEQAWLDWMVYFKKECLDQIHSWILLKMQ